MSYIPWGQIHAQRQANAYAGDLKELRKQVAKAIELLKNNADTPLVIEALEGKK